MGCILTRTKRYARLTTIEGIETSSSFCFSFCLVKNSKLLRNLRDDIFTAWNIGNGETSGIVGLEAVKFFEDEEEEEFAPWDLPVTNPWYKPRCEGLCKLCCCKK